MSDERPATRRPAPGDVPNEQEVEREFGVTQDGRPLAEQGPLLDENGTDIRLYTGEPVPTEHGYVIPRQSAVGEERVVGGGEFPNDAEDDGQELPSAEDRRRRGSERR